MKRILSNRTVANFLLSLVAVSLFFTLAVGTQGFRIDIIQFATGLVLWEYGKQTLDDGSIYYITTFNGKSLIMTGNQDANGLWEGPVTIIYRDAVSGIVYRTEDVIYKNGKRHGLGIITDALGNSKVVSYFDGKRIYGGDKSVNKKANGQSSFDYYSFVYPGYIISLCHFGFDSLYQERYLDTLDLLLDEQIFGESEFDDYYDDIIEVLEETPYDSIISVNKLTTFLNGVELLKHSQLRLAALDFFREKNESTYEAITDTYPDYLLKMEAGEVSEADFEVFCQTLDSCMLTFGGIEPDSPALADSVDTWLYSALMSIYSSGEDSTSIPLKKAITRTIHSEYINLHALLRQARSTLRIKAFNSTPPEVAEVALYYIFMTYFFEGDLLRESAYKAWIERNGILVEPDVGTAFVEYTSSTAVNLGGYVFDDGGSPVTERGVVWATTYNPGISHNVLHCGSGTGEFYMDLEGLEEGKQYYARGFATNSVGTSYGSCVSFTAGMGSDLDDPVSQQANLLVYPNPAGERVVLRCGIEEAGTVTLGIFNLAGQQVFREEYESAGNLEYLKELDVSGFMEGAYICQLRVNSEIVALSKMVIAR